MTSVPLLRPGGRVVVPWGVNATRSGVVLEIWGDPDHPSHIRVELDAVDGDAPAVLLLNPATVEPAA